MMEDCIYREAAIDAIWKVRITPGGELFNAIKRAQEELIKQLPSAGPERKKGKWIDYGSDSWECSCCGAKSYVNEDWRPTDDKSFIMNFCHYCGAEMGEDNGNS